MRRSYEAANRIVVLDNAMRHRLSSAPWEISNDKIRVIPNWADCELIRPLESADNPFIEREQLRDRFVVMHSGNVGLTQRLDVLVRATQSDDWPSHAVLLIVGDGARRSELIALASTFQNDRVRFLPYQPRENLCESLSAAHLHVVSTHQGILGCLSPSKLYGILAAGRPVLAIAHPESDACKLVNRHRLGWTCIPGNSNQIAKAVAEAGW